MSEDIIEKAVQLSTEKRYEEALEWYDKALEADPGSAWACMGKAEIFTNLDRLDEALEWYDKTDIIGAGQKGPVGIL